MHRPGHIDHLPIRRPAKQHIPHWLKCVVWTILVIGAYCFVSGLEHWL